MAKAKTPTDVDPTPSPSPTVTAADLAVAITQALELTRPKKITVFNRNRKSPWEPKDGTPKFKLKRKLYQHHVLVNPDRMTNEQIALANDIKPPKPGNFITDGYLRLERRKDKGVNITYPVRTAAQRLRLVSDYHVSDFTDLLRLVVDMSKNPHKLGVEDDDE
jgi:hypothetical protein